METLTPTLKKYDHWCIRAKNARGLITTVNLPGATKRAFLALVSGDENLLREMTREIAAKCLKTPGHTFSAQVRERLQTALNRRIARMRAPAKAGAPATWPAGIAVAGGAQ